MADELAGKKILLVDDDRDILATVTAALEDLGPEILTASDGNQGLAMAEKHKPDLVVLDMMMPKRSGFLVMEKLKRGKTADDAPKVIMITGNQGVRHRAYAEHLGVSKYMNKPFRMEHLVEAVTKLLA